MSQFTFVHAADLHLDSPFEGLGRVAPQVADLLRDSSLAAWDALVALCLDREAHVLLLAGDIYDGEERGLRAQLRFVRGLQRLSQRGVRVFVAHGNHDPYGGRWSAIREWPPGVTVFGHETVQSLPVTDGDGRVLAVVHGISHSSRTVGDNLAVRFHRGPESCPHFGVLHCNVDGDPNHALYAPCSTDDLRSADMDYWALGHIHRQRVLSRGRPWIVYSGGLQGRSLQPGEVGIKGAMVGTATDGRVSDAQFIAVPHVRFADLPMDITGIPDASRLLERIDEHVEIMHGEGPFVGFVIRVTLTGRGPLHGDLVRPGQLADLLKTMREEAQSRRPFLWWSSLVMATRPDLDRDAIRHRGDFSAEFLNLTTNLRDDAAALARVTQDHGRMLQAGALRRWIDPIPDDGQRSLLDEAETLALEHLEARSDQ